MPVRALRPDEVPLVHAMMRELWPGAGSYDFSDETVFVWVRERPGPTEGVADGDERLGGFISCSLRPWAEGCDATPVPYVEGWWVAPDLRGTGVGRALMLALEDWCRARGHSELGSDVEVDNTISQQAHVAIGFEPTLRVQFFRKRLR